MPTIMEVGDIWRKDTRELHEGNRVQHWLITNIATYETETNVWRVEYLCLENGRIDYSPLHTIDMTGNPYWKRVA